MKTAYTIGIVAVVIVILLVGSYAAIFLRVSNVTTNSSTTSSSTSTSSQESTNSIASTNTILTSTSTGSSSSSSSLTNSTPCCSTNVLNIGYFANINHAPGLIGLYNGTFNAALGGKVTINTFLFTSGTTEITSLLAGQLDMAYIGPGPAVTGFQQSDGGVKIVAGVADGGALFVVNNNSNITSPADMINKVFAAPGFGNTQDIALRTYLEAHGLVPGVNVTVEDTSNSNIVTLMSQNQIDGAWVPEPWATTLVYEAHAHIFLNEESLWPGGNFSTAELVATTPFLTAHPDVVYRIVQADVAITQWINNNYAQATVELNNAINSATGLSLNSTILSVAMTHLSFSWDPFEAAVQNQTDDSYKLGFITSTNITGIFDLTILNEVLVSDGLPTINS